MDQDPELTPRVQTIIEATSALRAILVQTMADDPHADPVAIAYLRGAVDALTAATKRPSERIVDELRANRPIIPDRGKR